MANEYDYVHERGHAANSDIDWGAILTMKNDNSAQKAYQRARFAIDFDSVFKIKQEQKEKKENLEGKLIIDAAFQDIPSGASNPTATESPANPAVAEQPQPTETTQPPEKTDDYKHLRKKDKNGEVVSIIKIKPKLLQNKWWGAFPTSLGATLGLTGGTGIGVGAAALASVIGAPFTIPIAAAVTAATALGGTIGGYLFGESVLEEKLPVNQDNWYASGRWGEKLIGNFVPAGFGQKGMWEGGAYKGIEIIADAYKKDFYIDEKENRPWKRTNMGHRIKEIEDGKEVPIPVNIAEWYHIGKLALEKNIEVNAKAIIEKKLAEYRKALISEHKITDEKSLRKEIESQRKKLEESIKVESTNAGIPFYELLSFVDAPRENKFHRAIVNIENLEAEHERSANVYGKDYLYGNKKGVGCLCYSVFKDMDQRFTFNEMRRPFKHFWNDFFAIPKDFLKNLTKKPLEALLSVPKNTFKFAWNIPKYFPGLGARLYEISDQKTDKQWFLERDPVSSMFWGNHYDLCDELGKKVYATISRGRIETLLYNTLSLPDKIIGKVKRNRPAYTIKLYDADLASKESVRALVTQAYQSDIDKKMHNFRYNYTTNEQGEVVPDSFNIKDLMKSGRFELYRPGMLINR